MSTRPEGFVDERVVLEFYLDLLDRQKVQFLCALDAETKEIQGLIRNLMHERTNAHRRVQVARKLWKRLFELSMSYIDADRTGYDELFRYFDEYVDFEEIVFASDSDYRDHTLHSLWVYFLEEYLTKNRAFQGLTSHFEDSQRDQRTMLDTLKQFGDLPALTELTAVESQVDGAMEYEDSICCVAALTHDLGYPLTKIAKIGSRIDRILPFFSIVPMPSFTVEFGSVQQEYQAALIDLLSTDLDYRPNHSVDDIEEATLEKVFRIDPDSRVVEGLQANAKEVLEKLDADQLNTMKRALDLTPCLIHDTGRRLRYSHDLESRRQHGFMGALLLSSTLAAFRNPGLSYVDETHITWEQVDFPTFSAKQAILMAIADHDSSGYRLDDMDDASAFLALTDDLEEFSRTCRGHRNRQFIENICKTRIWMDGKTLCAEFLFPQIEASDLDPEEVFRAKCQRVLRLFGALGPTNGLRLQICVVDELKKRKRREYRLEAGEGSLQITVCGIVQNSRTYLRTVETP
jgi:hypothetical protein